MEEPIRIEHERQLRQQGREMRVALQKAMKAYPSRPGHTESFRLKTMQDDLDHILAMEKINPTGLNELERLIRVVPGMIREHSIYNRTGAEFILRHREQLVETLSRLKSVVIPKRKRVISTYLTELDQGFPARVIHFAPPILKTDVLPGQEEAKNRILEELKTLQMEHYNPIREKHEKSYES